MLGSTMLLLGGMVGGAGYGSGKWPFALLWTSLHLSLFFSLLVLKTINASSLVRHAVYMLGSTMLLSGMQFVSGCWL